MAEEVRTAGRVWLWVGAAVLLIVVFLVARTMTRDRLPVHAAAAIRTELVGTVPTNGLVEPQRTYEFHSPLATTVKNLLVEQGDTVPAGKILMQLDDTVARARVASAQSALSSAVATDEATRHGGTLEERQSISSTVSRDQLDLSEQQRQLDALQKLQTTGAASASEVDAARQRVAVAKDTLQSNQGRQTTRYSPGEVARSRSAVNDAQANLVAAKAVLDQTTIRAPIAGTVFSIPAGRSDFVEQGKLLLQMADLKQIRVRAYFDEPDIGRLTVGQKVRFVWDARPGKEWHGHISQMPSTIERYETRNVGEVLIAIDDPDAGLLPETHVTVTVTTSSAPNTLTIPREALRSEGGKPYVYKIVNGSLVRTDITIGTSNLTQVPVTSGLTDGDLVATSSLNGLALEEGAAVRIVK